MEKFGLFDVITKLASDKNAINALQNVFLGALNKSERKGEKTTTIKNVENPKSSKHSPDIILQIMKNHDKLSKQIDEREKNKNA